MNPLRPTLLVALVFGLIALPSHSDSLTGGPYLVSGGPVSGGGTSAGGKFVVDGFAGHATGKLAGGIFEVTGGLLDVMIVPGDVTILIRLDPANQATLTWIPSSSGYILESTLQLGDVASWQPVTPAPAGNAYAVPVDQSVRFFRLRQP